MSYKKHLNDKFKGNELKTSPSRLPFFHFPRKSKYNCRGTDVFSNIVELFVTLSVLYLHG